MIKVFSAVLLLIFSLGAFSQNSDSLKKVIQSQKQDTNLIFTYKALISDLEDQEEYKEAEKFNEELFSLAKKIKFPKGYAYYYLYKGCLLADASEYYQSIPHHMRGLAIFDSLHMQKQVAISYRHLADAYLELANYNKAVELIYKEIKIEDQLGEKKLLSGAYLNLGNAYRVMEDYVHAETFYLKSFEIKKEIHDSTGIANCYNNLGLIYRKNKDYKKALSVYFKSLAIYQNLKNKKGVIRSYTNIGVAYKYLKNYVNALIYFNKAFAIAQETNSRSYLSNLYNNIGNIYILQNQPQKALPLLDSAVYISEQDKSLEDLYTAHEYLARAYSAIPDYEKAYKNHVIYKKLHDSIYNEENSKTISDLRTQFEVEKKEVEVKAISEAEKQKLIIAKEAQKTKGLVIISAVALLLVLTVVFLWVLFKRFNITNRQKQVIEKQKEVLDEKNNLLEEKQKEIIDSITYAKRLQLAILPSLQRFKKYFPSSFILYKPKDIVAGDFYWLHHITSENKEIVFVAAADSTGHGVPGAMVSVVCSNALNRAVKEFDLTDTGKILDKTRELVLETFSKSGEEIKDGMDISLCRFDFIPNNSETVDCQWSGANNMLWRSALINGQTEMLEIKANKQPIGLVENPKPYTTHHFTMQKGETIYLFTDGYADQFGGQKGKKYKYNQLQAYLLSIHNNSLEQQSAKLDQDFEVWKGDLEQVDDVTIIGIRV